MSEAILEGSVPDPKVKALEKYMSLDLLDACPIELRRGKDMQATIQSFAYGYHLYPGAQSGDVETC